MLETRPDASPMCRILLTLTRELNEAGWIDEVKSQSKGLHPRFTIVIERILDVDLELAKRSNPPISFQKLLDATTPIANGIFTNHPVTATCD
jgi:hypothetical protein